MVFLFGKGNTGVLLFSFFNLMNYNDDNKLKNKLLPFIMRWVGKRKYKFDLPSEKECVIIKR